MKIFAVLGNFGAGRSLFKKGWALPALFCGRDFDFDKDRVKGFAVKGTLFPQDMRGFTSIASGEATQAFVASISAVSMISIFVTIWRPLLMTGLA